MLSYCRRLLHWSLARVPRHRCIQLFKSHIPPLSDLTSFFSFSFSVILLKGYGCLALPGLALPHASYDS